LWIFYVLWTKSHCNFFKHTVKICIYFLQYLHNTWKHVQDILLFSPYVPNCNWISTRCSEKFFFRISSSSLCLFSYIQYIKFLLYKTSLDLWLYNSIKSFRTYFTCLCVVVYTTQWWPFWEDCSQFVPTSVSDFRKIILSFAPTSQLAINKLQFYCWQ